MLGRSDVRTSISERISGPTIVLKYFNIKLSAFNNSLRILVTVMVTTFHRHRLMPWLLAALRTVSGGAGGDTPFKTPIYHHHSRLHQQRTTQFRLWTDVYGTEWSFSPNVKDNATDIWKKLGRYLCAPLVSDGPVSVITELAPGTTDNNLSRRSLIAKVYGPTGRLGTFFVSTITIFNINVEITAQNC
ncbi:hypothetical protein GALMADRAFT_211776 [Galerina marginata CBS 339.88]|uniref:Uncharacterized protein n=1 Tax=Galerina marginata (strain CBS 339.88) TaxID=685588 RepID=A0A067SVA3_GALM3|nr:hypothetical protein GALMADRAFT_211776 [Galerina marginata CBS 339.88]